MMTRSAVLLMALAVSLFAFLATATSVFAKDPKAVNRQIEINAYPGSTIKTRKNSKKPVCKVRSDRSAGTRKACRHRGKRSLRVPRKKLELVISRRGHGTIRWSPDASGEAENLRLQAPGPYAMKLEMPRLTNPTFKLGTETLSAKWDPAERAYVIRSIRTLRLNRTLHIAADGIRALSKQVQIPRSMGRLRLDPTFVWPLEVLPNTTGVTARSKGGTPLVAEVDGQKIVVEVPSSVETFVFSKVGFVDIEVAGRNATSLVFQRPTVKFISKGINRTTRLRLDGEPISAGIELRKLKDGRGELSVKQLTPGKHRFGIETPGWLAKEIERDIGVESATTTVDVTMSRVALAVILGSTTGKSTLPPGVTATLDGKLLTDVTFRPGVAVSIGAPGGDAHTLEIRAPGFKTETRTIEIESAPIEDLAINLRPVDYRLELTGGADCTRAFVYRRKTRSNVWTFIEDAAVTDDRAQLTPKLWPAGSYDIQVKCRGAQTPVKIRKVAFGGDDVEPQVALEPREHDATSISVAADSATTAAVFAFGETLSEPGRAQRGSRTEKSCGDYDFGEAPSHSFVVGGSSDARNVEFVVTSPYAVSYLISTPEGEVICGRVRAKTRQTRPVSRSMPARTGDYLVWIGEPEEAEPFREPYILHARLSAVGTPFAAPTINKTVKPITVKSGFEIEDEDAAGFARHWDNAAAARESKNKHNEKSCVGWGRSSPTAQIKVKQGDVVKVVAVAEDKRGADVVTTVLHPNGELECVDDRGENNRVSENNFKARKSGVLKFWIGRFDPTVEFTFEARVEKL